MQFSEAQVNQEANLMVDSPCPLCQGQAKRSLLCTRDHLFAKPGVFCVEQCLNCGFHYTNPRPNKSAIHDFYPPTYWHPTEQPFEDEPSFTRDLRALLETDSAQKRLLDVGCGTGRLLLTARRYGWEVQGVEPSAEACEIARKGLGFEAIVHGTLEKLPESPEYDLITLIDVLEHVHDPVALLHQCSARLRPGGVLVVQSPNFASLERRLSGKYWYVLMLPTHLSHFTRQHLSQAGEMAGLELIRFGGVKVSFLYLSFQLWLRRGQAQVEGLNDILLGRSPGERSSQAAERCPDTPSPSKGNARLNWKGRLLYRLIGTIPLLERFLQGIYSKQGSSSPIFSAVLRKR